MERLEYCSEELEFNLGQWDLGISTASVKVVGSQRWFHKETGSGALSAGLFLLKPLGHECGVPCSQRCLVQTSSTCKVKWVRFIMLSFNSAMLESFQGPRGQKTVLNYSAGISDCGCALGEDAVSQYFPSILVYFRLIAFFFDARLCHLVSLILYHSAPSHLIFCFVLEISLPTFDAQQRSENLQNVKVWESRVLVLQLVQDCASAYLKTVIAARKGNPQGTAVQQSRGRIFLSDVSQIAG